MNQACNEQDWYIFSPYTGFGAAVGPAREDAAASVEASNSLAAAPAFLRVLLCTDGTVTRSLEAYFWEPIEVHVLAHAFAASECGYPALEIVPGDPILRRRVVLRGRITRSVYAFAESIMAGSGVAAELRRKLIDEKKGIGELLREDRLETYRELLSVRRAEAREWAAHLGVTVNAEVLVRSYRIFHSGRATIQIEEVFPEARFQRT